MTVLRGGKADCVPFTCYSWLIPDTPTGRRLRQEGLIPIDSAGLFRIERPDIGWEQRETIENGKRLVHSKISTPLGEVTEVTGFDPNYGSPWIREHYIKSVDDYEIIKYMYDHTSIVPSFGEYIEADRRMGDAGIVLGCIDPIPVQALLVGLMGTEAWCEGVMEHEEKFTALLESMDRIHKRQVEIAAESPAEVIWFPDNVTGTIMSPPRFDVYCRPIYDYACKAMRQAGKLSFAHYDGANKTLKDNIAATDLDIIEAFTPPPMEQMTVAEARSAWPDKVLSLNYPGNIFREPEDAIRRWTTEYLEQGGDDGKFIIGCTEDFDVNDFDRAFSTIAECIREWNV